MRPAACDWLELRSAEHSNTQTWGWQQAACSFIVSQRFASKPINKDNLLSLLSSSFLTASTDWWMNLKPNGNCLHPQQVATAQSFLRYVVRQMTLLTMQYRFLLPQPQLR